MKFFILLFATVAYLSAVAYADRNVVCFFSSWATYRPGKGKFDVKDIDATLCTHIIYGYVGLGPDNKVKILDEWEAIGLKAFEQLVALKKANPEIKILLGMGGYSEGSEKYSKMAADADARKTLVADVVSVLKKYSFDGFDLDWESPGTRNGDPEKDPDNFVTLLEELKKALEAEKRLLTITASAFTEIIDISYPDTKKIADTVDFINVLMPKNDFKEMNITGIYHPFALHGSPKDETESEQNLNLEAGIKTWLATNDEIAAKLNLGVGTYGTNFILADPKKNDIYAPYSGCNSGPYTNEGCFLSYNEFCELDKGWNRILDDEQKVPHFTHESKWVGIDDIDSIVAKAQFVKDKKLAGVMVWNLDGDDFKDTCKSGKYPLLVALKNALKD